VIRASNAPSIRARVVVEAANMPITEDAMPILRRRGIGIIPDIYANSGGVIASDIEYRHALGGAKLARDAAFEQIRHCFDEAYDAMAPLIRRGRTLLDASVDVALSRVYETMKQRNLL
jgi:glutamate dehydrogenase (NAD(P)+)